jgi:Tol biopolymer transport system component
MKRFALVSLVFMASFALYATTPAQATFPGANGRIAFLRDIGGGPQIFTMAPDGTHVRQLTSFPRALAFDPAWSPDGRTIAFVKAPNRNRPSSIWTMTAGGADKARLRGDHFFAYQSPSYSPDGSTIVFTRCYPNFARCQLQTMNADGSGVDTLTSFGLEVFDITARYSPDGSQIAFSSFERDGLQAAVYLMDADGSNIHAVTKPRLEAFLPDWSPDGSTIAFTTHCCDGKSLAISSVAPNGSNLTPLSNPGASHDFSPSWSPEGNAIVFERDTPNFTRFDTWIMSPDGTGERLLMRNAFEAAWGPAR